MDYIAILNKPMGLTRVIHPHKLEDLRLAPGRYPLSRVPYPLNGDGPDWLVLSDSDAGMSEGMWLDKDFQRFQDFEIKIVV